MAIALSALTGAFNGLAAGQGPGGHARAAAAGFNSVLDANQKAKAQQTQQAQADFARQQATLEFNMKMHAGAIQAGQQDREANDAYSDSFTNAINDLTSTPEGVSSIKFGSVENPLSEDELEDIKKHSPLDLSRIPVGKSVPRIGSDGQQIWIDSKTHKIVPPDSPNAHPAWDIRGILVDKNARIPLSGPEGVKPWLKDILDHDYAQFIPGANQSLAAGNGATGTIPLTSALSMIAADNLFKTTQDHLDEFVKTLNEVGVRDLL